MSVYKVRIQMSKYVMIVCVLITIGHTTSIRAGTNNVKISSEPGNRIDILKNSTARLVTILLTYTAVCVKKPGIFHSFRMFELQRPEWL